MASKAAEAASESKPPNSPSTTTTTTEEPPPPYNPSTASSPLTTNPGFCPLAFAERQANRLPGGGMPSASYSLPCASCGFLCGSEIPAAYRAHWAEWVDPSLNFRWESHVAATMGGPVLGGLRGELLGCWICWEYEQKWIAPMVPQDWYMHMRGHFKTDGYRVCKGKTGGMQRRRNCTWAFCPKIHS